MEVTDSLLRCAEVGDVSYVKSQLSMSSIFSFVLTLKISSITSVTFVMVECS